MIAKLSVEIVLASITERSHFDRCVSKVLCRECKFFGHREYLWGILRLRDEVETIRLHEELDYGRIDDDGGDGDREDRVG